MTTPQLPSLYKNIAAPAGTNPQDVQSAKDQLTMQYAPQEMGINSAIQFINQNLNRDVNAQQQYGQIADQKIAGIGTELAQTLQGNVTKTQDIYKQGTAEVGSAYDEAMQTLQGIGQSVQDPIKQGMAQYGIKQDQFGRDPLSRLQADLAVYQSRTASGKATATANISTLGSHLTAIAQKAVGDSEKNYAQKRTDIAAQVLKTIGELQTTAQSGMMEQLQKFSVLAETIGPAFRTLINQAAGARSEAARQDAKDQLDRYIKLSELDIKQNKAFKEDDPNSLDNQMKSINVAKGIRDLEKGDSETNYISDAAGSQRLQSLLDQARRPARGQPGLSGTQVAGIQNFINQNQAAVRESGMYNTNDPGAILAALASNLVDPKTGLVHLPTTKGTKYTDRSKGDYVVDMQTLLQAIEARYGNVGSAAKIGTKI